MTRCDVVIVGAGAAGMMCAIEAGRRGRSVTVIEHGRAPGEKIRISGGGRCNFTNMNTGPGSFLSGNPHFAKSAIKRYTHWDFLEWIGQHRIAWHEKTLGQLFCDESARQIVDALVSDMRDAGVTLMLQSRIAMHRRDSDGFTVALEDGNTLVCDSLVIATGGKSIPKMGATGFGYDVARQYGIPVTETRPGLVPLTFDPATLERFRPLAGVAADVVAICGKTRFAEAMLFTHRGLSGPAILQISSYWREGEDIAIRFCPGTNLFEALRAARDRQGRQALATALSEHMPKRLAQMLAEESGLSGNLADQSDKRLKHFVSTLEQWPLRPTGSEGYRTAEVTLGGVDTHALDSRTMQARNVPGLFFIGEVVDVTGWLGGYNFQWAWASGWSAGQTA